MRSKIFLVLCLVFVGLSLDVSALSRDIKDVEKDLKQIQKEIEKTEREIKKKYILEAQFRQNLLTADSDEKKQKIQNQIDENEFAVKNLEDKFSNQKIKQEELKNELDELRNGKKSSSSSQPAKGQVDTSQSKTKSLDEMIEEKRHKKNMLEAKRDSLSKVYANLQNQLAEFQKSEEIAAKATEQLNDLLARRCLVSGSYFLNIPYSREGVDLGIKSYEQSKGTSYYQSQMIRLQLLKNYAQDAEELLEFFRTVKNFLPINIKKIGNVVYNDNAKELLNALKQLEAYKRYKQYQYSNETYLGNIMSEFEDLLNSSIRGNMSTKTSIPETAKKYGEEIKDLLPKKD